MHFLILLFWSSFRFKSQKIFSISLSIEKLFDVSRFINDFMNLGTYDLYADPVSRHISVFLRISLLLSVVGSVAILILLRKKNKPWKLYLVPIIEYLDLL